MRTGASWSDVCIRNMSSRGLLIETASPPARGTYVEIRRGSDLIVAQSVWVGDRRCGLRAQGRLAVDAFLGGSGHISSPCVYAVAQPGKERRSHSRTIATRHEQNRMLSRISEFAFAVLVGGTLASFAAASIQAAFARPLSVAEAAVRRVD